MTTSPRPAITSTAPKTPAPAGTDTQAATSRMAPTRVSLPGPDTLNGHLTTGAHTTVAVEGPASPQAREFAAPTLCPPAGTTTAPPAIICAAPTEVSLGGHQTGRSQDQIGTHRSCAAADDIPGRQTRLGTHAECAAGDQTPAPATSLPAPIDRAPVRDQVPPAQATNGLAPMWSSPGLADPLLALAADILDDLERVRISNENRLRQLTRDQADSDGIERGFGLDVTHPDVARLAALVQMLGDAEHQATLNLQRIMRKHPLGPWVRNTKGIGEKQGARLIAAIGDPYWNTLHDRPRTVSELWAYCGYHVIKNSRQRPVCGRFPR